MDDCSFKGCPQKTFDNSLFCYYHRKVVLGLIERSPEYLKSKAEVECVYENREPNWDLAMKETKRIKKLCYDINKWAKIPIKELVHESLIFVATAKINKKTYAHYLNTALKGMLKNFIAQVKDTVSYYWKSYVDSISTESLDESLVSDPMNIEPENLIMAFEESEFLKIKIREYRKELNKIDRFIFDQRLYTESPISLRALENKLQISKSTLQRYESAIKSEFKNFIMESCNEA